MLISESALLCFMNNVTDTNTAYEKQKDTLQQELFTKQERTINIMQNIKEEIKEENKYQYTGIVRNIMIKNIENSIPILNTDINYDISDIKKVCYLLLMNKLKVIKLQCEHVLYSVKVSEEIIKKNKMLEVKEEVVKKQKEVKEKMMQFYIKIKGKIEEIK